MLRCVLGFVLVLLAERIPAATVVDPNALPPAAQVEINFDRDIKPIFDAHCLKCHGPEKPKSGFRLDNRESALRGGDVGVDILLGDSANSPLIHYVSGVVEDMVMPPPGRGEMLDGEQIGLLRAWIDQGAKWGEVTSDLTLFSISPSFQWLSVSGNERKFREIEGVKEGTSGGIEHFSIKEALGPDSKLTVEGRLLFDDPEFRITTTLEKTDLGFIRFGIEQWRRYYDDHGGFYGPFITPSHSLDRDLALEHSRYWFDLGLTLPNWPRVVLGYEFQRRDGAKSTLQWGTVLEPVLEPKNIYPSAKEIDERVHILKLDVAHEVAGWEFENNARVEIYELETSRDNVSLFTLGPQPDGLQRVREDAAHVQGANTVRVEKQLRDWWRASGGYLYSRLDGDSRLDQTTLGPDSLPVAGQFWSTEGMVLRRESHVFSVANLFLPLEYLSGSVGFQSEWTRQEGFGNVHLDEGDPNIPGLFTLAPASVESDLDTAKTTENVSLRFTGIPHVVLFGEARFDKESIGHYENQIGDTHHAFLRDTDATTDRRDWRAGFHTSPWKWTSWSAHYRKRQSDSDYDHRLDFFLDPVDGLLPGDGYSAFIRRRRIETDELQTKIVLRPCNWLKTTLTYQFVETDYVTGTDELAGSTPGGSLLAGRYDAHVYGLNVILTPWQRWYFSGNLTYRDVRTLTEDGENFSVAPYDGETFTAMTSANFSVNASTKLHAAWSFSRARFAQNNEVDGLPLGIDFTRHGIVVGVTKSFGETLSARLGYAFYDYSEPTTGDVNDYTAHGVFASLTCIWK